MKRYLKLLARTFSISASVMLLYRANIVFFLIFETLFLGAQFLTVKVGFALAGGDIAGWSREQVYLLTAVNSLSHQFFICFFINSIFNLSVQVWNGQFDYILLKPLHPLASMLFNGQFVISNFPNLLINAVAVVYFVQAQAAVSPGFWLVFLAMIVIGLAVRVALALICLSPIFYSERLSDVEDSYWSLTSLGRYPLSVYPSWLGLVLTFVLPIGMIGSFPSEVLFRPRAPAEMALALGAALLFVALAVAIFMKSLRRYQSVNSGV